MSRRRRYTQEFREEAVKLITEQGYKISEAAHNLGINASMLCKWKRQIEDGTTPDSNVSLQSEVRRLRKENKRLKMEREILKKAAAFFAKEQG